MSKWVHQLEPTPQRRHSEPNLSSSRPRLLAFLSACSRLLVPRQLVLAICGFLLLIAAAVSSGYRYQLTDSGPKGIYRFQTGVVERWDYVILCLPPEAAALAVERDYLPPGPCAGGIQPLLKRAVALPGDVVALSPEGLSVNGELLPYSVVRSEDRHGLALSRPAWGERIVEDRTLWVLGEHPHSFDSRYFGPVDEVLVLSVADAVITWGDRP